MPSFAISQFIILLEPLWVSAGFLLLSTGPYSSAKYARSVPQIALTWKSLFRVVESGGFLNRLRNGHLEKSAVTGV